MALNVKMRTPRVSSLLQWFDEPADHILVFEYMPHCETLEHFVKSNGGRLDERQARDLTTQVLLAAKECIDEDVFHRNTKLKNILIDTTTLKIKLTDFSSGVFLCNEFSRRDAENSTVWLVGEVLNRVLYGLPPYVNPEGICTSTPYFDSSLSGGKRKSNNET